MVLAALFGLTAAASAQDAPLAALHKTLATLHSKTEPTTELTVAKHQLRDWIETQIDSVDDPAGDLVLLGRINKQLQAVVVKNPDDQKFFGSLGEVRFSTESRLLLVTTAVGILCQYDESAYAYERVDAHWKRIWESEQNDYSPKKYAPQYISAVHVWRRFNAPHSEGPPFVLTLGNDVGCASSWHPVYYRVWRIDASGPRLLIDGSGFAFLRASIYAVGSINQDLRTDENDPPVDVLIEFTQASIGNDVREAVRHYLIKGDQVRRVDPVALSPRDFVDEWLTCPWNESATWSASPTLRQWHRKLHTDFVSGMFTNPTTHCQTPDLWQVTFESLYYLVRWRPPYHFTMVSVSDKPWPRCTQEDPEADEWRTLFSTQEWRW